MKINLKALIIAILIPVAVGALSGFLTSGSMDVYQSLTKPNLTPPGSVFPIVWTILYVLMGIASYLVFMKEAPPRQKKKAFQVYGLQLFFNFFWSILFFNFNLYFFSFLWIIILGILIAMNIILFYRICKVAGLLLVPYLLWVLFATYLNFMIYLLN